MSAINGLQPTKDNSPDEEAVRLANAPADLLRSISVALEVRLGEAKMTAEEMLALKPGAVVALSATLADRVDLYLNEMLVGRGELVAVGDKYGVRICEIAPNA